MILWGFLGQVKSVSFLEVTSGNWLENESMYILYNYVLLFLYYLNYFFYQI